MNLSVLEYVKVIRQARTQKGWSQKVLAEKSGIPQPHLSKIERGEIDLRFSNLIELARLVDMEVVIVPKKSIPSINALIRQPSHDQWNVKPAYSLEEEES